MFRKIREKWFNNVFSIKWIKFPLKKYERNALTMFSPKKFKVFTLENKRKMV